MKKGFSYLKILFLVVILLTVTFAGCIQEEKKLEEREIPTPEIPLDHPAILPDWKDGGYHDYDSTLKKIKLFNDAHPNLVYIFPI